MPIPNIQLRNYQYAAWEALESGQRRAALVWPRRAGKDTLSLHWACFDAHRHIGNYWHLFPEQKQARKAIWNGINKDGNRIIDEAFPPEVVESRNDAEMLIRLKCGSTWQLGGSDRYDALVGSNPRGVVFSEYAICNPRAYDFVRPILAENGGWALFPYTPRGRNHGFELFQKLKINPQSFAEILTCDDTRHMTEEMLADERTEMTEALYLQEYFCSWDYGIEGSFYATQMNTAMNEGRICAVPHDPGLPVYVAWDIGLKDATALWFLQLGEGGQLRFIDYYQSQGEQIAHYLGVMRNKGYTYGADLFLPHDAGHKRLGQPESVSDQVEALGQTTRVLPQETSIFPAIEACRVAIGKAVFDEKATEQGRAALNAYRKEWDDDRQVFKDKPLHDWASDGADAFRYLIRAYNLGYCSTSWGSQVLDYSELDRAAI